MTPEPSSRGRRILTTIRDRIAASKFPLWRVSRPRHSSDRRSPLRFQLRLAIRFRIEDGSRGRSPFCGCGARRGLGGGNSGERLGRSLAPPGGFAARCWPLCLPQTCRLEGTVPPRDCPRLFRRASLKSPHSPELCRDAVWGQSPGRYSPLPRYKQVSAVRFLAGARFVL